MSEKPSRTLDIEMLRYAIERHVANAEIYDKAMAALIRIATDPAYAIAKAAIERAPN